MDIIAKLVTMIFSNPDNNYKVFVVRDKEHNNYTLVGYTKAIKEDLYYEFEIEEVNNKRYGLQYQIVSYKEHIESNEDGIIKYLSSSLFPGVGIQAAKAIYDYLGDDTLDIIAKNPSILEDIKISTKQRETIITNLVLNKVYEEIYLTLSHYYLSQELILKIYDKYGPDALTILETNPYRLIYDFERIGFIRADQLAYDLGFPKNDIERLKAMLVFCFSLASNKYGLTYMTTKQLLDTTFVYSNKNGDNLTKDVFDKALQKAIDDNLLVFELGKVYLPYLYYDEVSIASKINILINRKSKPLNHDLFDKYLADFQYIFDIEFDQKQKLAIFNGLNKDISIITGGPGTGKTTIIKAIINIYSALHGFSLDDFEAREKILLIAPTGKASKRINEQTNFYASTIHKALGYNFDLEYAFDENNLLPHNLIIIDEASMIDNNLASHLLKAIKDSAKVVIVGDAYQLPSIGPGMFFYDLIVSEKIEVTYLDTIFRQQKNSHIIKLSSEIKNGSIEDFSFAYDDLKYMDTKIEDTPKVVNQIIDNEVSMGLDLFNDIEVLIPMYKGVSGIDNINQEISKRFNANPAYTVKKNEIEFHQNDKIMCLNNNSDLELLNGDLGVLLDKELVESEGKSKEAYIALFDKRRIRVSESELENFNLAYAISIHKAQGSEYKTVILVLNKTFSIMLKRKLLYTAVSRAKERLYIVGDINALFYGLQFEEQNRQTSLKERLLGSIKQRIPIIDPDIPFDYLGEDIPNHITPYYFLENDEN